MRKILDTTDDATERDLFGDPRRRGGHRLDLPRPAVFSRHGLPCSLYTDRGSHYVVTLKAGEKPDPKARTQVGRALAQLGIEHIAAFSPQARGRSERAFRTLRDRLPKELALMDIDSIGAANSFLAERLLPRWNAPSPFPAEQTGTARHPLAVLSCVSRPEPAIERAKLKAISEDPEQLGKIGFNLGLPF